MDFLCRCARALLIGVVFLIGYALPAKTTIALGQTNYIGERLQNLAVRDHSLGNPTLPIVLME